MLLRRVRFAGMRRAKRRIQAGFGFGLLSVWRSRRHNGYSATLVTKPLAFLLLTLANVINCPIPLTKG